MPAAGSEVHKMYWRLLFLCSLMLSSCDWPNDQRPGATQIAKEEPRTPSEGVPALGQSSPQVCECIDRGDIGKRLREARTAIAAYRNQIEGMRQTERKTGQPLQYSDGTYTNMQERVKKMLALDAISEKPLRIETLAKGKTYPFTCDTILGDPHASTCMRESIDAHEAVHRKKCPLGVPSYFRQRTMIEAAQEGIEAYEAEISFLSQQSSGLPCDYRSILPAPGHPKFLKCGGPYGAWQISAPAGSYSGVVTFDPQSYLGRARLIPHCSDTWNAEIRWTEDPALELENWTGNWRGELVVYSDTYCGVSMPGGHGVVTFPFEAGSFCGQAGAGQ